MFNIFTSSIKASLNVIEDSFDAIAGGDPPKTEDIAKMLDAGLTIAGIAEALDIGESILQDIMDQRNEKQ